LSVAGEEYTLQNHSAQPPSRYDFVKDLARLEAAISSSVQPMSGFAILLTNDRAYWSEPRQTGGVSGAFCLHEGRRISGELDWSPTASAGTRKNREEVVELAAEYHVRWQDYSNLDRRGPFLFWYLCLPVSQPAR
jgi:hypothetical protein